MVNNSKKKLQGEPMEQFAREFDAETGLIKYADANGRKYATRINASYARSIYEQYYEPYYDRASNILRKLCALQDQDETSRTYGLWPVTFEEKLSEMAVPDYNFADFIGSTLICLIKEREELLEQELAEEIKKSIYRAAYCSMKRHVGLDYTNVICMSCFTIIGAGEVLKDAELIKVGTKELKRLVEYTRFCGTFSEYNSPCYIGVAAGAIANMMTYLEDSQCRKMACELNDYLWKMGARHYSSTFQEYTPPYIRNYSDLDNGRDAFFIWCATEGKYGRLIEGKSDAGSIIRCPEQFYPLFEENGWYEYQYYKKNDLREPEEDATIVQNLDSPDLTAYSYKTKEFLFGSFQKTDLWGQRRTHMVIWNPEKKRCLKLCALKDGVDFSSAMAYTIQDKNRAMTLLGFSNNHGDKHYIVDPLKGSKIKASKLSFMLKLGGATEGLKFEKQGEEYVLKDHSFEIHVRVGTFLFDGKPGEIRISDNGLELICFEEKQEKEIDLKNLGKTYGIISMSINDEAILPEETESGERIAVASGREFLIEGYSVPREYDECITHTVVRKF